MVRIGNDGVYQIERRTLDARTVVHDVRHNATIMTIDGAVALPPGAEIELTSPNENAKVVGVRLLAGSDTHPVTVCLDVEVPEAWWNDARPAEQGPWA